MSDNFVSQYLSLYKHTEVPDDFSVWCGLFTIGAACGQKIYVDMGIFKIYPNMFTVLVAGAGRCKKSTAINESERLLRKYVPLNIISQKLSMQAFIKAMSAPPPGVIYKAKPSHEGVVFVDELVTFIDKAAFDAGIGGVLVQMYDCKEEFKYMTLSRGEETLKNTCLNVLGGTTVDLMRKFPAEMIGGGLASRIIFIFVDEPKPPVPFPSLLPEHHKVLESLGQRLIKYSKLSGPMTLDPEARVLYEDIYKDFYKSSVLWSEPNTMHYASRRCNLHLIKLAMILCLADDEFPSIKARHIQAAADFLQNNERNLPRLMVSIASNEIGEMIDLVYRVIHKAGRITRSGLTAKVSHNLDATGLDNVLTTLVQGGKIVAETNGRTIIYRMPLKGEISLE